MGGLIGKVGSARRLTDVAGTGLRELPANAAWLLSRALNAGDIGLFGCFRCRHLGGWQRLGDGVGHRHLGRGDRGLRHFGSAARARAAGRSIRATMPGLGDGSVESLLRQADEAAEEARNKEARALALAQEAKGRADDAERTAREMDEPCAR